jgi:4-amino-4-deoxy-L-arabinose transferase-like glycosyltransferase
MSRRPSWPPRWRRPRLPGAPLPVWIAAGLLLLVSCLWAVLTPATRAPDEAQHLNSVLRVADGDGWPRPGDARMTEGMLRLVELTGAVHDGLRTRLPGTVNPNFGELVWTALPPQPAADRPTMAELTADRTRSSAFDQMTQHPPGYYAVSAAVFDVLGAADWRYDHALLLLRVLTALTVAASVPFCLYLACRDLTGRETTARAAAFLPLFIPQLGFIGGAVTNDGAAIAAAAVLTATLVRLMTAGPTVPRLVAVAVAAGAACWTKGTALTILPAVPLAVAVAHHRFGPTGGPARLGRWVRDTAAVLGGAFVLGGWWWGLNLLRYGRVQPEGWEVPVNEGRPLLPFGQFVGEFADKVSASFFGYVGLLEAPLPVLLTGGLTASCLVLMAVGLPSRRRLGERAAFALVILLTIGVLLATTFRAHQDTHNFPGLQGRYLFVLLVPILALVTAGAARIARLLRVRSRAALTLVAGAGVAVAAAGLVSGFARYYLDEGASLGAALDQFLARAPVSSVTVGLLALGVGVLLLLLAYVEGRATGEASAMADPVREPGPRPDPAAPEPRRDPLSELAAR